MRTIRGVALVLTGLLAAADCFAQTQVATEKPPTFRASELFKGGVLAGPDFRINDVVTNDGYLNHYEITVGKDTYPVISDTAMEARLQELQALQKMNQIKGSKVYTDAVTKAAKAPLNLAEGMITAPGETLSNIGSGFGTFFDNVGHSMFGGASDQEEGALTTVVGLDIAKRECADKMGIDPYTQFPPVEERLAEISWTAVGGNLTVSAGFSAVPDGGGAVLRGTKTSQGMRGLIREKAPSELKELNEAKLKRLGINETLATAFLEHPKFSPTEKTYLVAALENLTGVTGKEIMIQRAVLVQNDTGAMILRRWAEMMDGYHNNVAKAQKIVKLGIAPALQRADGTIVWLVPIDYLAWTNDVAATYARSSQSLSGLPGVTGGELWILGTASPTAKQALAGYRWTVKEQVRQTLKLD
jgi:hypothetical protein